jgi:phosphatidylglycerophosphatase GEP4
MNLSGTINTFRLLYTPRLARPHVVLNQFSELTSPLGKCIAHNVKKKYGIDVPEPDIRAIVIDKDNCIARPHALEVWPAYKVCIRTSEIDGRKNGASLWTSLEKRVC